MKWCACWSIVSRQRSGSYVAALLLGLQAMVGVAQAGETIDAAQFGLNELEPGGDATPALRRAIEACRARHADGLKIPPGTWHVFPDYAVEKYLAVANNNAGIKRIVLCLDDLQDFRVDARDAILVCHGTLIPISGDGADGLTIEGLTIDWDRPFNFQAEVIAVQPEGNSFDVRVHDEVVYEIRGARLIFREKPSDYPDQWKEWAPPTGEREAWEHNLQWNMWFEGDSKRPVVGEHLYAVVPDPRVAEIAPRVVRIYDAVNVLPQVGWVLTVKGMMTPNRTSPAIRIAGSKGVVLEDVTIHHAGGMGIVAQRSEDIALRRIKVALPAGKDRLVTTTADATHFNGCRGEILLEDCFFENMLDDATNIHGCFVRVEEPIAPATLVCRRVHSQQRGLVIAEDGDRMRFVESRDLQPYGEATVESVRNLNSDLFQITLNGLPPGGLRPGSGLYNLTWQPNLTMRRCTVRNNRARTMLIATGGGVIVENCHFEHSSMAGVQLEGDNGFWWESGPTRNAVIRNNLFRNNAGAALRIMPQIEANQYPDAVYHGGIRFENNRIETFHRRVVEATAVDGLLFANNSISLTDYAEQVRDDEASFTLHSGRNIVLEGNTYDGIEPLGVWFATPAARPVMRNNRGIVEQ